MVEPRKRSSEAPIYMVMLRIDHIENKVEFVRLMKEWMSELDLSGRLVSRGTHFHFLFVEGSESNCKRFIVKYQTVPVLLNVSGELSKDRFFDLIGQTPRDSKAFSNGFHDSVFLVQYYKHSLQYLSTN